MNTQYTMADSASESDSSSIDGGPIMMPPSPITREQLQKRIESLQQQNRVLKVELETYKLRVKALQEENRDLRKASVIIVGCLLFIEACCLISGAFAASKSRAGRGIHLQHVTEEDPGPQKGERVPGASLREGGRMPHQ